MTIGGKPKQAGRLRPHVWGLINRLIVLAALVVLSQVGIFRCLDTAGHPVPAGEIGAIVVKLPMPPGCLPTLWNNDDRFVESYMAEYPGYYKTGDAGYLDEDGYVFVMARTDDIINVAGHRLSTGGMEEVLAAHPDVAECAVVGAADQLKGQVPLGFLVLKSGVSRSGEDIVAETVKMVREQIGPVAAFKEAVIIQRLPKTRSGKILRGTIQKIADGVDYPCLQQLMIPLFWTRSPSRCSQSGIRNLKPERKRRLGQFADIGDLL